MYIVIDILKKVNSEVELGHIEASFVKQLLERNNSVSDVFSIHVTDDYQKALLLLSEGKYVIPILCDENNSSDFSDFKYLITNYDELDMDDYLRMWQRFVDIPWHIVDTERCMIREMTPEDLPALYDIYSVPSITSFTEPLFPSYEDELEYTINYIKNVYSYFGFGTWVVVERKTNQIIGRVGFNYRPDYDEPELGFVCAAPFQQKGYSFEVCSAVIEYMKKEFDISTFNAFSSEENIPSVCLLKKLGFMVRDKSENIEVEINNRNITLRRFVLELDVDATRSASYIYD